MKGTFHPWTQNGECLSYHLLIEVREHHIVLSIQRRGRENVGWSKRIETMLYSICGTTWLTFNPTG